MWKAFRPPPTEKRVHWWGWQEEELNSLEKDKHCSYEYCKMAWPRSKSEELAKRLRKQQNFCVTKWSFLEVIRWVVAHSIIDVTGTTSLCYRPVKKHWLRSIKQLWSLSRNMRPLLLMLLKIYCVKDENLETVTVVKMSVIIVAKILGDSVTVKISYCNISLLSRVFVDSSLKWM